VRQQSITASAPLGEISVLQLYDQFPQLKCWFCVNATEAWLQMQH